MFEVVEQHLNHQVSGTGNIEHYTIEPMTYTNGGFDEKRPDSSDGKPVLLAI